jgi:hypothetical protein
VSVGLADAGLLLRGESRAAKDSRII